MLTNGNRQSVPPGQVIFAEGETGDSAYLIESGVVEISASRPAGSVVLARLHAGDLFGEMALIDHGVRSATARALEATTLAVIRRDQVMRKMDAADPLIKLFLRVLLRRLRETSSRVDESLVSGGAVEPAPALDDTGLRRLRELAMDMLEREQRLEEALRADEFKVFFQPMVELASGRAAGFEALLRWHQPDGTVLEAEDFIGLAGDIGLMGELTRLVLETTLAAIVPLQERVGRDTFMSLNLSARQLAEPAVIADVLSALQTSGVGPDRLLVEVTEGVLIDDPVRVGSALRRLKAHGVSAAIDDFGTGYSSLSCLERFPIDVLKLDRSFVAALSGAAGNRKIVRAVVRLAQELGLTTVAEGIERPEQLALLRDLGYDLGQGFLFSPALPLEEMLDLAAGPFVAPLPADSVS